MTKPPSRLTLFTLAHCWLIFALALFGLGSAGVFFAAFLTVAAPETEGIAVVSGALFFLAVISLTAWLYALARRHNLLPALQSSTVKDLALRKLAIVLGAATFFAVSLFWLLFVAALARPFSAYVAGRFFPYALLLNALGAAALACLVFLGRDRLLASWLPVLVCPYCRGWTATVNYWQCAGGCRVRKPRHVLSPCPTCGTRSRGIACSNHYCGRAVGFDEPYNEFEVVNRDNKYVTCYNPLFWWAALALEWSLFFLYLAFASGFLILGGVTGLLVIALVITLLALKPKRLARNPYYCEGVQQWTRSATA